jgi:hypothetical protein
MENFGKISGHPEGKAAAHCGKKSNKIISDLHVFSVGVICKGHCRI